MVDLILHLASANGRRAYNRSTRSNSQRRWLRNDGTDGLKFITTEALR